MKIEKSKSLFSRAKNFIPGGVNSPVRAFKAVEGTPYFSNQPKDLRWLMKTVIPT